MTAIRTVRARKKQVKNCNAAFQGNKADLQYTINPKLAVTLIILQGLALGALLGLIIILIKEGF